jgi:single-strand DNA-binding protein
MSSFNKVILMGRLTRNPDLRYTPQGTAVTEIGLAINREYTAGSERKKEVTFVDVTLWSRAAEVVCQYMKKGSPILIEGRLSLDSWEGQDGQKRSKLRVVAESFKFIGSRQEGDGQGEGMDPSGEDEAPRPSRSGIPSASPRYSPPGRTTDPDSYSRVPPGDPAESGEGPVGVDDSDIPF